MGLITKLEKKYSRTQLYNYCKDNKIEKCSKLQKHDYCCSTLEKKEGNSTSIFF